MKKGDEPARNHLTNGLLVRAMDDELSPPEAAQVESHLSVCEECRQQYQAFRLVSDQVESAVAAIAPAHRLMHREHLAHKLQGGEPVSAPSSRKVLRRFGWGMAIAATFTAGVIFAPRRVETVKNATTLESSVAGAETFEVNGETFVSLPYSNPDLPMNPSHIVRMEVPVSSLADAGVVFEPVSTQITAPDHSVLADVLLGIDGQPLGVHVLTPE